MAGPDEMTLPQWLSAAVLDQRQRAEFLRTLAAAMPDGQALLDLAEWIDRDVDAKWAILDEVAGWRHLAVDDGYYSCAQATLENGYDLDMACGDEDRAGGPCDCGMERRRAAILSHLATMYADRDGWREEWGPQ